MSGAGKGDSPRNCFSTDYRDNYDLIKWTDKKNTISPIKAKKQCVEHEKNTTKKMSKDEEGKKETI